MNPRNSFNREEHIRSVHEKRRTATEQKIEATLKELSDSTEGITFAKFANKAGVSEGTLYHSKYRASIEALRAQRPSRNAPKRLKVNGNTEDKDAIIESLRRRVKKLEDENKNLRNRLSVGLSDLYKSI